MVTRVVPGLRSQPARKLVRLPEPVEPSVARDRPRDGRTRGEPSSPTSCRTGPSIGTMALVAIRQLSPTRLEPGTVTWLPRKLRRPIATCATRNEELE